MGKGSPGAGGNPRTALPRGWTAVSRAAIPEPGQVSAPGASSAHPYSAASGSDREYPGPGRSAPPYPAGVAVGAPEPDAPRPAARVPARLVRYAGVNNDAPPEPSAGDGCTGRRGFPRLPPDPPGALSPAFRMP